MVTVAAYLSNKQTIHTSWFVHSSYIDSKTCELKDIYNWSRTNNLSLSRSITVDIVFTDNRRHRQPLHSFPALPGIGRVARLTLSTPAVPNCCCSKGPAPYWPNPPFLIFDIRALWRSGLSARQSARMSKIKNGGLDQYGKV